MEINFTMQLTGIEETLTVSAESPMISSSESKVGGVVENIQIENVPINTRNTQELALLVPGAKPANNFDPTKGSRVSVSIISTFSLWCSGSSPRSSASTAAANCRLPLS